MLLKCQATGLSDKLLSFLASFFRARSAHIVLEGGFFEAINLQNMVFQGTVLGPSLWNVFFADVATVVQASGLNEALFADDLTAYASFCASTNHDILQVLQSGQAAIHAWGARNRVTSILVKRSLQSYIVQMATVSPSNYLEPCLM